MATFEQFYKSLSSNSQVRGKEFEKLVKWFLKTEPRWNNLVKEIWLWDEHPKRDEWGPDCGIDLVFEVKNRSLHLNIFVLYSIEKAIKWIRFRI